jgi:hypothetical protein
MVKWVTVFLVYFLWKVPNCSWFMLFYSSEPIGPEYFLNYFGCGLKLSWDILDQAYQHRVEKTSCRLQINQFILHQKNDPFYPMRGKTGQWSIFFRYGQEKEDCTLKIISGSLHRPPPHYGIFGGLTLIFSQKGLFSVLKLCKRS